MIQGDYVDKTIEMLAKDMESVTTAYKTEDVNLLEISILGVLNTMDQVMQISLVSLVSGIPISDSAHYDYVLSSMRKGISSKGLIWDYINAMPTGPEKDGLAFVYRQLSRARNNGTHHPARRLDHLLKLTTMSIPISSIFNVPLKWILDNCGENIPKGIIKINSKNMVSGVSVAIASLISTK
jgi:hypothetical protein